MSLEPGSRLTIMSTAREMSPGLDAFPKEQNSRNPLSQRILGSLNLSPGYDQIYKQNGLLETLVVHRTQSKTPTVTILFLLIKQEEDTSTEK